MITDKKKKILFVDDEESILGITEEYFQQMGYQVMTAKNGFEAIQILEKETIDCCFTDINMPKMDGLTLTRKVKESENFGSLPVIVFSSIMAEDIRRKAQSIGADAQITKPEIERLVHFVAELSLAKKETAQHSA